MEKYGCEDLLQAIKKRLDFESRQNLIFSYDEIHFKPIILSANVKNGDRYFPVIENSLDSMEQHQLTIKGIFSNAKIRFLARKWRTQIYDYFTKKTLNDTLISRVQGDDDIVNLMQCSHSDFSLVGIITLSDQSKKPLQKPFLIIPGIIDYDKITEFENKNSIYIDIKK